jgi:hypothetical protein
LVADLSRTELAFDLVLVGLDTPKVYSVEDFLRLPIHERVACLLRHNVDFFKGGQRVDRKVALASLRLASASLGAGKSAS